MRARFAHDHDLMYTIVDHYLQNHRGKLTEEEKSRVCYNVNCTKLSHHLFMHLVQNPRLPLRFVVQAMLVEQLHSHHSMLLSGGHHHHAGAAGAPSSAAPPASLLKSSLSGAFGACGGFAATAAAAGDAASSMTLGDILQRDAVLRQSAHIRASMQATTQRIDSLERELAGLRTRLRRRHHQGHHEHQGPQVSAGARVQEPVRPETSHRRRRRAAHVRRTRRCARERERQSHVHRCAGARRRRRRRRADAASPEESVHRVIRAIACVCMATAMHACMIRVVYTSIRRSDLIMLPLSLHGHMIYFRC
ncbi:Os07g0587200, partial [Oryza sativa Japonica Group]